MKEITMDFDEKRKYELCDMGVFNQIILGYVSLALRDYQKRYDVKFKDEFIANFRLIAYQNLDFYGAESAEEFYLKDYPEV